MSINSACVYLNTPIGGGGVRHTAFCIIWTNTKINLTFKHLNNQTFQHSNHLTINQTTHHQHNNTNLTPLSPIVHKINSILPPHKPRLPPSILYLANCTRPLLNRLKSTHTSPQAYITILILSIYYYIYMILYIYYIYDTILYQCMLIHITCISIHVYDIHLYYFHIIAIYKHSIYMICVVLLLA